jgi:hypothetical protein
VNHCSITTSIKLSPFGIFWWENTRRLLRVQANPCDLCISN